MGGERVINGSFLGAMVGMGTFLRDIRRITASHLLNERGPFYGRMNNGDTGKEV